MSGLTVGWEYLTGNCVATNSASRHRAEWPPHPARVFMALAAAWFETGEDRDEGETLRWLEKLGDPVMRLPPCSAADHREVVNVYVPVNDNPDPYDWQDKKKKPTIHMNLGSVSFGRARQPRTFPSVWVGDAPCFLHWPDASDCDLQKHGAALDRLCGEVSRIGHSSSLVRMWVAHEVALSIALETWVPDDALADLQTRRVSEGTLAFLDRQFNRKGREKYLQLCEREASLKAEKPKSDGAKQRREQLKVELEQIQESLRSVNGRDPIRPNLGLWTGYRCKKVESSSQVPQTSFDSDILILAQTDGPRLPLVSTLTVTQALRGAVMSHCDSNIPDWVSGHKPNGEPLRDGNRPHLAYAPLPFVGSEYADGHLLGIALVFPRAVPRAERGRVLGAFVLEPSGHPKPIRLTLGALGVWTLIKRDWTEARQALQPETWTAYPSGATTWATVTPVVLDRFPKSDSVKECEAWRDEVAGIVTTASERFELPAPVEVAFGTTSWHLGSPRATAKRRPLRGHPAIQDASTSLGDGFPIYPTKSGNGARPQLHVCIRFAEPVVGPILLCAGRFLGYGLCKPLGGGANQ